MGARSMGRGTCTGAQGFTLVEMVIVVGVLAVMMAIVVPSYLRARSVANESSAAATLRSLVTVEAAWRQTDVDRNGISDYWVADVSGLYRTEIGTPGSGTPAAQVDAAVATADESKVAAGAPVPGAPVPDTGLPTAALLGLNGNHAKSGYLYAALKNDLSVLPALPYAADPDGNGQAWTSTSCYGFSARPEVCNSTGTNTLIVNQMGLIYRRAFGTSLPTNAPDWPGANPASLGWTPVQ